MRESITRNNTARGIRDTLTVKSISSMVALARRSAPNQGGRQVGAATALVTEMPHTLAALTAGRIDDWAATSIVRETAILSAEHRRAVDDALAELFAKEGVGHATLVRSARAHAQRLDPAAADAARPKGPRRSAGERPAGPRHDGLPHRTAAGRTGRRGLPPCERSPINCWLPGTPAPVTRSWRTPCTPGSPAPSSGQPIPVSVHLVLSGRTLFRERR